MKQPDGGCARFPLGLVLITPVALEAVVNSEVLRALGRHVVGDWGDLSPEDIGANEEALYFGNRLLSAYVTSEGTKFWIITEADRSATTILLPDDY